MKKHTITTYSFNELSEKSQAYALDEYRYSETDGYDYDISTLEDEQNRLDALGYTNAKIQYSGFFSQGDGASFTADVDLKTIIERLDTKYQVLKQGDLLDYIYVSIKRISHHYSHENTCTVDYDAYCSQYYDDSVNDLLDKYADLIEELANDIEEDRKNQCHEIYKKLGSEYEYLTSDEYLIELFTSNDYEFTEDGEIF